jgi:predicted nucleic acid-binding protein
MARYFLDSSALVKRYHQESGSVHVENLFNAPANRFFVSRLALVEVHSSFARLVREGVLTSSDFGKLISRLESDVATGVLTVAAVSSRRLEAASSILGTLGLTNAVRTLDAIHLATAQALHARSRIAGFVAADKKLLAIAAIAGGLAILDVR